MEMLVVISIISILAGLVLAGLSTARRRAKEMQTEALLTAALRGALDRYEADYQDYPPSEGDITGIRGSELLWRCLRSEKKEGPYLDAADVRTCDSNMNGDPEIADAWNRPIRYLHHRDYGSRKPNKLNFRLISAGANGVYEEGAKNSDDIVNWDKAKPDK